MASSFLLPLSSYPDPTPKAGLLRAFDMAASITGKITALVHEVDIPDIANILADTLIDVSGMIAAAEARSRANAQDLTNEVTHLANRFGLDLTVRHIRTRLERAPDMIAAEARTVDYALLVPAAESAEQMAVTEAVLFGSGGPTWIFPEHEATAHLEAAAIAWDGGRAAARAVRDALPVLALTKQVTILAVPDDKPIEPASVNALETFLRHHGIAAQVHRSARNDLSIGDALQSAAIESGAGLLVMGAYGHSRIREFVLGGATRAVLAHRRLPILMSH